MLTNFDTNGTPYNIASSIPLQLLPNSTDCHHNQTVSQTVLSVKCFCGMPPATTSAHWPRVCGYRIPFHNIDIWIVNQTGAVLVSCPDRTPGGYDGCGVGTRLVPCHIMSVDIYKCRWWFTNISGDLQMSVRIYKSRWRFTNISGDLQMSVGICKVDPGNFDHRLFPITRNGSKARGKALN